MERRLGKTDMDASVLGFGGSAPVRESPAGGTGTVF
jgi:hypothetical protein